MTSVKPVYGGRLTASRLEPLEQAVPSNLETHMPRPDDPTPIYNLNSAALAKHRRKAKEGLGTLSRTERVAYADAVESAVRASQAAQLRSHGETMPRPNCASGTTHSCGKAIHTAVAAQQRAALLAYPAQVRKARTDAQWREMYDNAMAEKRFNAEYARRDGWNDNSQAVQPRE
jgi:hypothetical protein